MKFKAATSSTLNKNKLLFLLRRMRERITDPSGSTIQSAMRELHNIFFNFFTTLGNPVFQPRFFIKGDHPDPSSYNKALTDIKHDLKTCIDETKVAGKLAVGVFNIGQTVTRELNQRSNEAASKIIDLNLLNGNLDQEVIIAGDDFNSLDKVDTEFVLQNPRAEVKPDEGVATLKRVSIENLIDESTKVQVVALSVGQESPGSGSETPTTAPTKNNLYRFYEGKFYDYIGQARPEGGIFHLEETISQGVEEAANQDSPIIVQNLADTQSLFDDALDQRNGTDSETSRDGLPIRTEDINIIDRGATKSEKNSIRRYILDGNADTFWECEYIVPAEDLTAGLLSDELDGNSDPDKHITPDQLRAAAVNQDTIKNYDLEIQITLELKEEAPINWTLLNPMNFGESAWLEITEVSTATDKSSAFIPIEGFDKNRFANIITDEANEELQENTVADILAPNKYSFRGTAVYSFPVRKAKFIRYKIKQRVPVPTPHQRMALQLNRTISSTQSHSRTPAPSGGLCCFIFLEARYGDGTMDYVVRRFRDENMTDRNRRGYYKLAEVLVPLMRKYKICKFLVRTLMTDPMVYYGKYYYGENKLGWIAKPITSFWLRLFNYLGGNHPFVRENGEIV